jgi:hypothetical protein
MTALRRPDQPMRWKTREWHGASHEERSLMRGYDRKEHDRILSLVKTFTDSISKARQVADIDQHLLASFRTAEREAIALIEKNYDAIFSKMMPLISVSDDGIITLQWRNSVEGLALLFAGDGFVTVAFQNKTANYDEGSAEFCLSNTLPEIVREAVSRIASQL